MFRVREPLSRTIRIASGAALVGLVPHYVLFYLLRTPLWTDTIAEWIMARTPSRYAVPILDSLGSWAKPWADTGGLATLGFALFLTRFVGSFAPARSRSFATCFVGIVIAFGLARSCGYASFIGGFAFWVPALAIVSLVPLTDRHEPLVNGERRAILGAITRRAVCRW